VRIALCGDVEDIVRRYALGPAAHSIAPPFTEGERAVGLDRGYHVSVAVGQERDTVTRLVAHREDFELVGLSVQSAVCVLTCPPTPTVEPDRAARGSSFVLRFCCWPEGAAVMKIFTTPDGRTMTLSDTAHEDGTVRAAWGGTPSDAPGAYEVMVRGSGLAEVLHFRID
jgi:hypothetical protein